MRRALVAALVAAAVSFSPGCAALEQLRAFVQAPRFEEVPGQPAELRLLGPSGSLPLGGAGVRLWAKVTNPNAFGFTLDTLTGTLFLEETRSATADFPLGLPLGARAETVIPIDLAISFSDLPGLANVVRRAIGRQPLAYRLDGTIGVDAGRLGTPTFGPMTLLRGETGVTMQAAGATSWQSLARTR
jgi:late embryogenesis abundant protein